MPLVPVPLVANPAWMPDAFTPWLHLQSLQPIPFPDEWGVYMIATKGKAPPTEPADPLDPDIVNIGATGIRGKGATSLRKRVDCLRMVLRGGDATHGPAYVVRAHLAERGVPLADVYAAFYPVWEHDADRSMVLVMLLERLFIYNWTVTFGRRPAGNRE